MIHACQQCGEPFKRYRKTARFCGRSCMGIANTKRIDDYHGLRYMLRVLGDREVLAAALGVSNRVIWRLIPANHQDALYNGRMVSIGGILAKRCSRCEVTRELEHFHNDCGTASGASSHCVACDTKYRLTRPRRRIN